MTLVEIVDFYRIQVMCSFAVNLWSTENFILCWVFFKKKLSTSALDAVNAFMQKISLKRSDGLTTKSDAAVAVFISTPDLVLMNWWWREWKTTVRVHSILHYQNIMVYQLIFAPPIWGRKVKSFPVLITSFDRGRNRQRWSWLASHGKSCDSPLYYIVFWKLLQNERWVWIDWCC